MRESTMSCIGNFEENMDLSRIYLAVLGLMPNLIKKSMGTHHAMYWIDRGSNDRLRESCTNVAAVETASISTAATRCGLGLHIGIENY